MPCFHFVYAVARHRQHDKLPLISRNPHIDQKKDRPPFMAALRFLSGSFWSCWFVRCLPNSARAPPITVTDRTLVLSAYGTSFSVRPISTTNAAPAASVPILRGRDATPASAWRGTPIGRPALARRMNPWRFRLNGRRTPVNAQRPERKTHAPRRQGDLRSGAYDPGAGTGMKAQEAKTVRTTRHERDQHGASVRSEPETPQPESPIPEGVRRGLKRPQGPAKGRSRDTRR
jgi:hypothetical protein